MQEKAMIASVRLETRMVRGMRHKPLYEGGERAVDASMAALAQGTEILNTEADFVIRYYRLRRLSQL